MEIEELLAQIRKTDSVWSSEVIQCVCDWLREKFPGEEVWFLSLPKEDDRERLRILEQILTWERERRAQAEETRG